MHTETVASTVDFCQLGRAVIETESLAVRALTQRLDQSFTAACQTLLNCQGRIVVTGMGKSGHIASKIAATLASTGSPAFFVHPGEASHGDMGMITKQDVVIAISNSGNTPEIITIVPVLKRLGVPLIGLTGERESAIAKHADINLDVSVSEEACPLGLAPTASTTAALVMGDALAIALLQARGFTADDFARSHPGGLLGRRLLLQVKDIMHADKEMPIVSVTATLADTLLEITAKKLGMSIINDATGALAGIFTDGDLRRALANNVDIHNTVISNIMTKNCMTITPEILAAQALGIMNEKQITSLVVVADNAPQSVVGVLHMHDLLRAGVL